MPERDGGRSASTSGTGGTGGGPTRRVSIRPAGSASYQKDWLLLLDEANLPHGLGGPTTGNRSKPVSQQRQQQQQQQQGNSGDGAGSEVLRALHNAPSLGELAAVVQQRPTLSPGEVAAALDAAVRLMEQQRQRPSGSSGGGGDGPGSGTVDALPGLLLSRFSDLGPSAFSPAELLVVARACGKMHQGGAAGDWRGAALAAADGLKPRLAEASTAEVARLAWALAAVRARPDRALLEELCRAAQPGLRSATGVQLSLLAWSLARLGHRPPAPWVAALLEESEARLEAAGPQALANITWALGTWR